MSALGRPGTIVRVPDGRIGTVVFNGLEGVGIKWGGHDVSEADFEGTYGDLFPPTRFCRWWPDAMPMLRRPYEYADPSLEYVCDEREGEIVNEPAP